MNKFHILATTLLSSLLTILFIGGSILFFNQAAAAPPLQVATPTPEPTRPTYVSVSGLAFMPVNQVASYSLNRTRQMLTLDNQTRDFSAERNIFIAPLTLPDQQILTGMTVFGEDFDDQGAVQVRLKRCEHSQGRCTILTDATSTDAFAIGRFETVRVAMLNEVIDNNLHAYFLELELTALGNSGLRAVRLELLEKGQSLPATTALERWELAGNITRLTLSSGTLSQVRVCTDDLSNLPNITHFPSLLVDGQVTALSSNSCITVWGRSIEIRRALNTAPSSGSYQILR